MSGFKVRACELGLGAESLAFQGPSAKPYKGEQNTRLTNRG